jgi:hypothetical protein
VDGAEEFLGGIVSQGLSDGGVDAEKAPVRGGLENADGGVFKNVAVFGLGLAQGLLGPGAMNDLSRSAA